MSVRGEPLSDLYTSMMRLGGSCRLTEALPAITARAGPVAAVRPQARAISAMTGLSAACCEARVKHEHVRTDAIEACVSDRELRAPGHAIAGQVRHPLCHRTSHAVGVQQEGRERGLPQAGDIEGSRHQSHAARMQTSSCSTLVGAKRRRKALRTLLADGRPTHPKVTDQIVA